MNNEMPVATYKLVRVYDMRIYDWDREEYIPLAKGDGNICQRCGREHAKVYVVENTLTHKEHFVGSTCSKKLFGWEPTQEELKAAKKVMVSEQKRVAYEKYKQEQAKPLAEKIAAMEIPAIVLVEEEHHLYNHSYKLSCGDVAIWCWDKNIDASRRLMFHNAWRERRINEAVEEKLGTRYSKQAYKLIAAIQELAIVA